MLRAKTPKCQRHDTANAARRTLRSLARLHAMPSLVLAGWAALATAQTRLPPPTPTATDSAVSAPTAVAAPALPEPIYWKQLLFLIPYKWGSAAEPASAQSVHLYVSKDRGASWQKISDAKPTVTAFNYRAEGDGEYWFAVRTLDIRGKLTPDGAYQPELRVIVDTTIPRIDELRASASASGAVEVQCRATDVNLDPNSLKVETQASPTAPWQAVALERDSNTRFGLIQARWLPTGGARPATIRATLSDKAGNAAVSQARVDAVPPVAGPAFSQPPASNAVAVPLPAVAPSTSTNAAGPPLMTALPPTNAPAVPPTAQPWQAGALASAPFRLWTSSATPQDDGQTAYGTPRLSSPPASTPDAAPPNALGSATASSGWTTPPADSRADQRVPASYAGISRTDNALVAITADPAAAGPRFAPLEPFRQPANAPPPTEPASLPLAPIGPLANPSTATNFGAGNVNMIPVEVRPPACGPASPPKLVGSRTFALEYDLDDATAGVSRVELWGTRDGGQTWNRYSQDDDNRSPLVVTVDNEGLYGFRIVVHSATGVAAEPPRTGDEPELWVAVDLQRPIVELTSIARGEGNHSDHLVLHWRAQDNNLEARPISLYFSSRPTGPWSAIATNLEDTGEYSWRVERYVPTRIYLRIEARDTAGNLAAFQTREPVEFNAVAPKAQLRGTPPTGASANAANGGLR